MTAMWLAPQVIICPLPSPLTAIMQYFCGLFGHTLQHQLQCLPVSSWWRRIQSCSHRITQKMTWYVCGLWPPISLKKTLILGFFSNKICNIFLVAFIWIMQRMTLPGNFFMLYNGYFLDNSIEYFSPLDMGYNSHRALGIVHNYKTLVCECVHNWYYARNTVLRKIQI